jgi:hypothetical protein
MKTTESSRETEVLSSAKNAQLALAHRPSVRTSTRRLAQYAALAALTTVAVEAYSPPAYSCSFNNLTSCVTGPVKAVKSAAETTWNWVENQASGVGNWFKDQGLGIAQFAVRDIWGKLLFVFSCPYGKTSGVLIACFPDGSMQKGRITDALDFIAKDTRNTHTYVTVSGSSATPHNFQPSSFLPSRIAYILDGHSSVAQAYTRGAPPPDQQAVTTAIKTGMSAPMVFWPRAYSDLPTTVRLAGLLVHETDHTRFGYQHSCGDGADANEDGPYGTQIQYLAKLSRTGNPGRSLSAFDREGAWDEAVNRLGQICNSAARTRLWNTYLNSKMMAQIGVFRNGTWFVDRNSDGAWNSGDRSSSFGMTGDKPVVGTFNCQSQYNEVMVTRGSTWFWSRNNQEWDGGDSSFTYGSNPIPVMLNSRVVAFQDGAWLVDQNNNHVQDSGDSTYYFGQAGDLPVTGVWNPALGASSKIAVFRGGTWFLDFDGSNGWSGGDTAFDFGGPGDLPFAADFNTANAGFEVGVFRNGDWLIDFNGNHSWDGPEAGDKLLHFGQAGDVPVVAPLNWGPFTCP